MFSTLVSNAVTVDTILGTEHSVLDLILSLKHSLAHFLLGAK